MGLGWHVVLQQELPGVATNVDGKALIHRQRDLDEIARALELEPLTAFVSVVPEALTRYLQQQGLNPENFPVPEEEWFAATDGLKTVRGLLVRLRAVPDAVLDSYRIVRDLQAIERVLTAAEQAGVSFHLASDLPALETP